MDAGPNAPARGWLGVTRRFWPPEAAAGKHCYILRRGKRRPGYDPPMAATITDADIDRLERYLQAPERIEYTLPVDAIQGLLAAVVSAPAPIPAERWLAAVLGQEASYAHDVERVEIEALLNRFHDATERQLNEDEGFDFVLYGEEGAEDEFAAWCEGYLLGVELAEPGWAEAADEDEVEDMLLPFFVLSGRWEEARAEAGEPDLPESEERELFAEMREALPDQVLGNRRFWFEQRIPEPVRREGPKVGRNDPCPCGSGRKYKNCHGGANAIP